MNIVTFENPTIEEDYNKPIALANLSYPYNSIGNPRRFEELLYSIFKRKIETTGFENFDGVSPMSGVGDQGRDCALLKKENAMELSNAKNMIVIIVKEILD